jgi:hypothetical protein
MAELYRAQPTMPTRHEESFYCYDPNCRYCKDLREMQEEIKSGRYTVGSNHPSNGQGGTINQR